MIYEGSGGPVTWEPDNDCFESSCEDNGKCLNSYESRSSRIIYDGNCSIKTECRVPGVLGPNPCKPSFVTLQDRIRIFFGAL